MAIDKNSELNSKKTVLNFETCKEYADYLKSGNSEIAGSEKNVPKDAMTLSDLGRKTDIEIIQILNQMAVVPNKSDIRVMYAHGYGFSWTKLQIIAEFKGYTNTNEGSICPHFIKEGLNDYSPETDTRTIYIDHGVRENSKLRKFTFTKETNDLIDDTLGSLGNLEKSKVFEEIIREPLILVNKMYKEHKFVVKYRPSAEEQIL